MDTTKERASKYLSSRISRRQAIRVGGIAAMGLIFSKPAIETIRPRPVFAVSTVSIPPKLCVVKFNVIDVKERTDVTMLAIEVCASDACNGVGAVAIGLQNAGLGVLFPGDGSDYKGDQGSYGVRHSDGSGKPGFPSVILEASAKDIFTGGECDTFRFALKGTGHSGTDIDCLAVNINGHVHTGRVRIP